MTVLALAELVVERVLVLLVAGGRRWRPGGIASSVEERRVGALASGAWAPERDHEIGEAYFLSVSGLV